MSAVTIVIPVYNEGDNIRMALSELDAKVSVDAETWLVYDTDGDTTVPVARQLEGHTRIPFRLMRNKYGKGALNAIKTGLEDAETELIVVTMADLCDPPEVIDDMVAAARRESAGCCAGLPVCRRMIQPIALSSTGNLFSIQWRLNRPAGLSWALNWW